MAGGGLEALQERFQLGAGDGDDRIAAGGQRCSIALDRTQCPQGFDLRRHALLAAVDAQQHHPLRPQHDDRRRLHRRGLDGTPCARGARRRQRVEGDGARHPRQGMQPQRHLGDHPQRAQRADQQLADVVAGDVLHHPAAAVPDGAVGEDEAHADGQVARGAEAGAQRSPGAARHDAANGGRNSAVGVEHEALAMWRQRGLQRVEAQSRLHHADQVTRLVLHHGVEPRRRQHDVAAARRRAPVQLGAAPARHHGQRLARGAGEHRAHLGLVARRDHQRGHHAGHRVRRCGRLAHVRSADDVGQRVAHRRGAAHHRSASPAASTGWTRWNPGTSPQSRGVGSNLPGLHSPSGSKAARTRSITVSASPLNIRGM